MVAKKVDFIIAGSNSLLASAVLASDCDVALTKFRDYRPVSLAFCAELQGGKVRVTGPRVGQDMADQLNQLRTSYKLDPEPASKGQGLRIVDDKRSVFHMQSTPAAAAVLKSSRTLMAHPAPLASPGRAHLGQISGIQTTAEGSQFRLIQQHLHRFEPQTLSWIAEKDTQPYSRIGLTREGRLMTVPMDLRDRSDDGKAQVSLEQSSGALHLQRFGEPEGIRFTPISESGEALQLARIGLAGDVLYATGPAGELLRGDLGTVDGGCLKMRLEPLEELERWHEGGVNFKGFMHDDEGRLNGLLLDRYQQLHSCPLTERPHLISDWNLSDVLLNVIDKGMPEPGLHALAGAVDLGRRGKVALEGGTLLAWDPSVQRWDHTDQVGVDHLERGLDGFAYVLQAGQLKAVSTTKGTAQVSMSASYDLAPPHAARLSVTLDDVLAADPQRVITGFAVQDGRHIVSLDQTNQLRAHIDGKETVLAFTESKDIQALALDHFGNLYAQSRAGELLKLDKTDWQSSPSSKLAWVPVPLPGDERLKSLRMGADQQLIASWGKKHRQMNISALGTTQWGPVMPPSPRTNPPLSSTLGLGEKKGYLPAQAGPTSWAVSNGFLGQKTESVKPSPRFWEGFRAHLQPIEGLKSFGRDIQHRFNGRKGLQKLYDADNQLRGQLKPLANVKPVPVDMQTRLDRLGGGEQTQNVVLELKKALADVEKNSRSSAIKLGDMHHARVIPEPLVAGVQHNKKAPQSSLSLMRQAFESLSPTASGDTAALLRSYETQGVVLSKYKPDKTRDLKNPTGLLESDLIHHAQTLSQLTVLITQLESEGPDLAKISAKLTELMQTYRDNPVHIKVSQSINSVGQAEALYRVFKLLSKDLGTPGSALNLHMTRMLGLTEGESVRQALIQEIQHSESGQSINPSREKTKGVAVWGYGMSALPVLDFTVGVSRKSGHGVTITRTDKGVNIEIKANTVNEAKGAVGVGDTFFPVKDSLGGGLRVGGEAALSYARDKGTTISFNVKQANFSKMMDLLTGEGGDLYDLLDIGTEHTSGNSAKNSVDLNLSAMVQGRSHFKSGGEKSLVRAVIGGSANLNAVHWENSRSETQGQDSITRSQGSDFQLFNKGALTAGVGPFNSLTGVKAEPGGLTVGAGTACDISYSISFDKTRTHVFNFVFKQPSAVEQRQVNELQASVLSLFAPFKGDLPRVPQTTAGIGEQLNSLQVFFDKAPVPRNKPQEYFELKKQLQGLVHQHRLASEGKRELATVESTMTCVGLNGDAKHSWMDDAAPANKAAILALMKKQPQLMQMLNELKSSEGTSVSIVLEVKPDVLRRLEGAVADSTDARYDVELALKSPDNLRVKSMSVSYKASRTHSMGLSLPLVNLASTAAVAHSQKVFNAVFEYGANPDEPLGMARNAPLGVPEPASLNPEFHEQNIRTARRPEYQ